MRDTATPLTTILERCLDRVAGNDGATAIWRTWEDAVGTQIARRAQPIRLRGRTLVVAVSSASWMQELQLLKPTLRTAINARLARPLVGDLFFVHAEGPTSPIGTHVDEQPQRPAAPAACATPPDNADLSGLPEPLRRGFADLLEAWRRRARA